MTEKVEAYHKGYNTAKSKYLAEIKELRNQYEHQLKDINTVFPLNLINEIYDEFEDTHDMSVKQIIKIMQEKLTTREYKVLELRYGRNMNLEEIGNEFDVTRERIRQIENKAIRKLNLLSVRNRMWVVPYEDYAKLQEENRELKAKLEFAENNELPVYEEKKILDANIEELNLSVRASNCLKRAGVYTVGEIVDYCENGKLCRIRNMGRKSAEEIREKLHSIGIEVKTGIEVVPE